MCSSDLLFTEFHPAREQVVNACANLYYFFLSYVEEDALIKEEMPYPSVVMEILLECFTLKAHTRWLLKFGSWVGNTMENFHRGSKTDKIVEAAKEYVRENYGEKLTLAAIASKIGISQGYLSSVFKKQTGGNLNDYINQMKIEKAKMCIRDRSNGLLLHGTYARSSEENTCKDRGVDECNTWGDYFYLEALRRRCGTWNPYW